MYASNQAAIREYVQSGAGKQKHDTIQNQPSFDDILRLAAQHDAKAVYALEKMAHHLGIGLSMLMTGLAPARVVIIGEITRAWKIVFPVVEKVVNERSPRSLTATKIIPAEDATQPRLRGSAALILQKHFGAPTIA